MLLELASANKEKITSLPAHRNTCQLSLYISLLFSSNAKQRQSKARQGKAKQSKAKQKQSKGKARQSNETITCASFKQRQSKGKARAKQSKGNAKQKQNASSLYISLLFSSKGLRRGPRITACFRRGQFCWRPV